MKLAGDQGLVIRFFLLCYASLLRRGILVPASPSATLGTSTGGQLMPSYATQQHSRRPCLIPGLAMQRNSIEISFGQKLPPAAGIRRA